MKRFVQGFAFVGFAVTALGLWAVPAGAQGVRYNDVARTKDNRPLSNGAVAVCVSNPSNPGNVGEACQPLATIYTDATLSTPAANPILADTNGNFWFWAPPGTYFVEFYSPGKATEPFAQTITLGCVPNSTAAGCGSTGTSQNNTWTGTNTFGADAYFKSGEPWFDVKAFGAKCDDATDDTAAIQATLAAIPATGGLVMIPGVCKFTSTLVISKPDVTIEGKGHFQFITQNAPVTYLDFQGTTGNGILVSAQGFKMRDVGVKYPTTIGGPLAPPATPTLTQVAGAGCPAEPYYVQTTYVNPQGETSDSAEATFTTTSGNCLQVQSPATATGATAWNVYVSANPNNETRQNATPIAIGTSWTFGGTLVNLAFRPPFNTTAYSAVYDNNGAQLEGVKLFTDAALSAGTANMANGYTSFGCCGKLDNVYVAGFGVGIAGAGANNDFSVMNSYIQSNNVGAFVVNGADINFTRDDFEGNVVGNVKMLYGSPYTLSHNYFEQQGTNPPSYNVQVGDTSIPPQGFTPTPGAIFIDGNFMQCNLTAYPPAPIVVDIVASLDIEKNSFSQCGSQNIIANFAGTGATIKVLGNISDAAPLAWTTSTTGFVESDLNGSSLMPGTPVFFGLGVTGNLSVSTLSPGDCVQAGTGGLLTTATNPCGAGGTLSTITPQPAHAGDVICANSAPTWTDCVQGIGGRTVSGTSDAIVASDRGTTIAYASGSAVASSLTSAVTLGNNFYVTVNSQGAGTVTLTPTAGQINGAAALVVSAGQTCYIHSPDNVNYTADCNNGQISWGAGMTATASAHGVSVTLENRSYFGNVTLAAGTGTFTLPGGDSFTSTATFGCTANDTTTISNGVKAAPASTTTATVTGTGTDVISVICAGH